RPACQPLRQLHLERPRGSAAAVSGPPLGGTPSPRRRTRPRPHRARLRHRRSRRAAALPRQLWTDRPRPEPRQCRGALRPAGGLSRHAAPGGRMSGNCRVALVNPEFSGSFFGIPLGLAYLGAALEERGHTVKLFDFWADGLSPDEQAAKVAAWQPDLVGV